MTDYTMDYENELLDFNYNLNKKSGLVSRILSVKRLATIMLAASAIFAMLPVVGL